MSLITKADFVAVPSTDWKRSRAFYVDTLGLRPDETGQAEFWIGEPVVWVSGWGGRWGVWKNGQFITLSSNVVTGGG